MEDSGNTILGLWDLVERGSPWTSDKSETTWVLEHLVEALNGGLDSHFWGFVQDSDDK